MYKMKEVCNLTGLTEKTVRFYVEQKLVNAKTESGLHYKSYSFDDGDIQRLKDIAVLRSAEFSIADIRRMLEVPASIPGMLAEKEKNLEDKITSMKSIQSALRNLTIADQTDVAQVADAIEPRSPLRKETPKKNRLLWLCVYSAVFLGVALLLALQFRGEAVYRFWWPCIPICFLAAVYFPFMGLGYFRYNRKHRKAPCRGEAKVVSVIDDEGVEEFWEETAFDVIHGMMTLGFFHWNWVRPDHWIPLVQFEVNGEIITTAYRYGGMKNSWRMGDTLEVAWYPGKEKQIYPCGDRVIRRKAWIYLLTGLGMMAILWMVFYNILN